MTVYMWIATGAWALIVAGYLMRSRRSVHIPLVCAGIALDVGLVLFLQFTRGAVQKALEFSLEILKQAHIGFSTSALLLYIPVVVLGIRILRGDSSTETRQRHRSVARLCLFLRTLGFLFMFSMLQ